MVGLFSSREFNSLKLLWIKQNRFPRTIPNGTAQCRPSLWLKDGTAAQPISCCKRSISVEPSYYYLYEAHALPKWYGKPGDTAAFAQSTVDRIGGPEGDFVYFRIALDLNCCKGKGQAPDLSWPRVKQGFSALEQLYGSTNYELNALAFIAIHQKDTQFAQLLFARIGDNWAENVWGTKEKFDKSKTSDVAAVSATP
jgi:hypothetical protein